MLFFTCTYSFVLFDSVASPNYWAGCNEITSLIYLRISRENIDTTISMPNALQILFSSRPKSYFRMQTGIWTLTAAWVCLQQTLQESFLTYDTKLLTMTRPKPGRTTVNKPRSANLPTSSLKTLTGQNFCQDKIHRISDKLILHQLQEASDPHVFPLPPPPSPHVGIPCWWNLYLPVS